MRTLRLIFFLLLSYGFTSAITERTFENPKQTGNSKKSAVGTKLEQNITKDQIVFLKRKVKTKGLLVIVPHIPKIYNLEAYVYNEYFFQKESKDYYCSLQYTPCKRGPPHS